MTSADSERTNRIWPTDRLATIHLPSASLQVNSAVPASMKAMPCHCAAPNAMPAPAGRLRSATALLPATGLFLQHDLVIARGGADMPAEQIGRASCRERVCQYG